jgi:dTMP kinase
VADRMEEQPADFFERVRQGYADLAATHPDRIKVVSARGSVEETEAAIWNQVTSAFSL